MKGADVFAEDPDFFEKVGKWAQGQGGLTGTGIVQVRRPDGRLLTVFEGAYSPEDRQAWPQPTTGHGGPAPDLFAMPSRCAVECRWKDWFVEAMRELAERAVGAVWVLDDDNVAWLASDIDVYRLRL